MFGMLAEANLMIVNADGVVQLGVTLVASGHHHQLSLVVTKADTILHTVVLGEEQDVSKVRQPISSKYRVICEANGGYYPRFAWELAQAHTLQRFLCGG